MMESQTVNTDATQLDAILGGSRAALEWAATVLERDQADAAGLHASLLPHCGRAHVVAIVGAPGVGKSTLVGALVAQLGVHGRRVAVVAVDPTGPGPGGGALLGDRTRMDGTEGDELLLIRSVASAGPPGGLFRTAVRIIDLFDAAGFDTVIVETVGTGQSEVEIARFADTSVIVCPPGLGDEVQTIEAGVLEIADLVVVNKADLPAAARMAQGLAASQGLDRSTGWQVPVLQTVATRGHGVPELLDRIDAHGSLFGRGRRLRADAGAGPSATAPAAPQATDDELFQRVQAWREAGRGVALATVVRTWGSSPRAEGSHLAIEEGGGFVGSVSGGCVEGAVISEAMSVIADGRPKLLEFGVSDQQAWDVGLACGGKVQVYVERIG